MKHTGRIAAALGLALSATLLVSVPAQAAVTGSMATAETDIVLYGGKCHKLQISYSLEASPDVDFWGAGFGLYGSDGKSTPDGASVFSAYDPVSGSTSLSICPSSGAGRFTLKGSGEWSDFDTDTSGSFTLPSISLTVRLARTKTELVVVPHPKDRVELWVSVEDKRPEGFLPTKYASIKLQALVNGKWVLARDGDAVTDRNGDKFYLYLRPDKPLKVRAIMVDFRYKKSKSKVVIVPK